ncbi:MAG: ribbon-helix-helix protein, CopG family [Gemmatimonadetes bacterium]|nr:ribbon-helix-helix protein, CopG family [Gemmatimonadota bacterium]
MSDHKRFRGVREPVQVYLDQPDRDLLDEMAEATGLSKAELLRRGLRRLSDDTLGDRRAGWSLEHLEGALDDQAAPSDLSARHDEYLYGTPRRGKSRPR